MKERKPESQTLGSLGIGTLDLGGFAAKTTLRFAVQMGLHLLQAGQRAGMEGSVTNFENHHQRVGSGS